MLHLGHCFSDVISVSKIRVQMLHLEQDVTSETQYITSIKLLPHVIPKPYPYFRCHICGSDVTTHGILSDVTSVCTDVTSVCTDVTSVCPDVISVCADVIVCVESKRKRMRTGMRGEGRNTRGMKRSGKGIGEIQAGRQRVHIH
jgi:hypothetical protein